MDKIQQEVLNGLIHNIEDLKKQLAALEEKVAAFGKDLEAAPAPLEEGPIDMSATEVGLVDISDIIPVEDLPEPAPAEPEPIPGLEAQEEPAETPDDDLPEPDFEPEPAPAEPAPAPQPIPAPAEPAPAPEPIAAPAEPAPAPQPIPAPAKPAPAPQPIPAPAEPAPAPEPIAAPVEPAPAPQSEKPKARSLVDLAAEKLAWKTDFPGIRVKNIRSAISLIDRAQFIGKLFGEDFSLYDKTISELNELETLDDAVRYITGNFPDWDLKSDLVYSFMMAIRKKLG